MKSYKNMSRDELKEVISTIALCALILSLMVISIVSIKVSNDYNRLVIKYNKLSVECNNPTQFYIDDKAQNIQSEVDTNGFRVS